MDEKFQRDLWEVEGINYDAIKALWDAGYQSIVAVGQTPVEDLAKIVGQEISTSRRRERRRKRRRSDSKRIHGNR
jgi:hypothetical protein